MQGCVVDTLSEEGLWASAGEVLSWVRSSHRPPQTAPSLSESVRPLACFSFPARLSTLTCPCSTNIHTLSWCHQGHISHRGATFFQFRVLEQKPSPLCCYSEPCPSDSHPIFWSCPVSFFLPVSAPKFLEQVLHHLPGFLCGSLFLSPHQAGLAAPGFTSLVHWN